LNFVGPTEVTHAAGLVREGRVISLAMRVEDSPGRPRIGTKMQPQHLMIRDGGDHLAGVARMPGIVICEDVLLTPIHDGTHIDGLAHVGGDGVFYNGVPAAAVTSMGAERIGVEQIVAIVGRGILLDVAALELRPCLPPGFEITPKHLEAACARQGVAVRSGDTVYIRTGWLGGYAAGGFAFADGEPGIGLAAAAWLADRSVTLVGSDNFGVEVLAPGVPFQIPVHVLLMRDHGVYLAEFCVLDELADTGRSDFLSVIAPLLITGGTGSPVNPLAIL
jgi:kynurenine formamidase